jgi:hypothetical protein
MTYTLPLVYGIDCFFRSVVPSHGLFFHKNRLAMVILVYVGYCSETR